MSKERQSRAVLRTVPLRRVLFLILLASHEAGYNIQGAVSGRADTSVRCADHCAGRLQAQKATLSHHHHQGNVKDEIKGLVVEDANSRLGSRPPKCISKCGNCKPCTPVRVVVHPGTNNVSGYYPEAWRCKCGGKLYMP